MSRSVHRILAALLALWFTVLTVEPARLHSCPMHDGLAIGAPTNVHAGHGQAHQSQPTPDTHHVCSCLGTCATSGAPAAPITPSFEVAESVATDLGLAELTRPAISVEYRIPFANGPPRA